jgi:hypothetical protein
MSEKEWTSVETATERVLYMCEDNRELKKMVRWLVVIVLIGGGDFWVAVTVSACAYVDFVVIGWFVHWW